MKRVPRMRRQRSMTENEKQRLQKTRDKIAQMKAVEQSILAKDKNHQRKERTRRLIQNGALAEKYLHCEGMEPCAFEKVLRKVAKIEHMAKPLPGFGKES